MKVHFASTIESIDKRIFIYRIIRESINYEGHTIVRDWIEEAYNHRESDYDTDEVMKIATLTRDAVADCDVAIFEVTEQSFGIGYQAALATSLQKPVLILQEKGSRGLGTIGMGVESPLRSCREYNSTDELESIVKNFIAENNISTKDLRFNMVLERDLFYFLTNESGRTGVSKSQIVRDLIRQSARNRWNSSEATNAKE